MAPKIIAVLLYVCVLIGLGVIASRRTRNTRDYYAGGKSMGFWAVAFSSRATGESAWLLLGLTGFGAAFGVKGFWIVLGEMIGVGGAWLFMSRRFKRLTDRYDSITVPDYLESRFRDAGHGLRFIAAGALLIFVPIYVSAQIHATGEAFSAFLEWNYYWGALFGFGVVMSYITFGGFKAVVWSDVFQGSLMLVGLVALPLVGIGVAGGIAPLLDTLRAQYPDHLSLTAGSDWNLFTIVSILGLVAIGIGFLGSPQVFVRFISLRSEKEIGKGTLVALTWTLLADSGAVLVGIVGRALIEGHLGTGSEEVLPRMVNAFLPAFVAGLFIAVVLSAIMSTIDSLLVVASSAGVRDYYQKIFHPDLDDTRLMKLSHRVTIALALVSLAVAMGVAIATSNGIKGSWNADTSTLTLTGEATPETYAAALGRVKYDASGEAGARTLVITPDDGAPITHTFDADQADSSSPLASLEADIAAIGGVSLTLPAGEDRLTFREGRTGIFWFVIFGWSGIAATFCPTMILSLFWGGFTARGAKWAMVSGFLAIPFFKFVATAIPLEVQGVPFGDYVTALDVLAPAFAVSMALGVVVSLTDAKGRERLRGFEQDLAES